ncbi:L-serine dehydratase/L-threonine deaminase isoform X2 [Rousettus aegyptiacus]|uniref:L-serine dehydratase/L-threonine deaminase isoform X2 n=1 Tax=Rousettus aegyptiacus TaxID=9407 RepID=UPI00168CE343|nr:L-serine dehydratase/L-threonine deaminase isoform X2 [Rousettus aegyptiacus]
MTSREPLHVKTPLRGSTSLSKVAGTNVYLKMDNAQPSGSFKIRGIGHLCQMWAEQGCEHFVCPSAGNAGMAAAYAARTLGIPATIVVPSTTPALTIERLKNEGATVQMVGEGRPHFRCEGAEGDTERKAGGHRAVSGWRGPVVRRGPGPAGGGLGGCAHRRHGDHWSPQLPRCHGRRHACLSGPDYQCCQGPVCEDRGGSDPEAVSGAPHFLGSYLGPGGCGRHRKVCGYVPGPFETRSAASGTQRLLFGMPRESIAANSPHSSVSHRFLKLPVSETVQCSDKNRKANGTNEVSLITVTGGNTD